MDVKKVVIKKRSLEELTQEAKEIDANKKSSSHNYVRKTLTKEEKAKEELQAMMEYEHRVPQEEPIKEKFE